VLLSFTCGAVEGHEGLLIQSAFPSNSGGLATAIVIRHTSSFASNFAWRASSRDLCLIKEAVDALLQFPKIRKMIFQLREASFAGDKTLFKICELSAASGVGLAFLDLDEERHP
jgi:hypothetical protein